jgi:hypothetical protein
MDEGRIFRARVWKKFWDETEKLFGTRLALLVVSVYSVTVGFARYYILGRSSAMNFFLDLLIDSVLVGVPFILFLSMVNILRAPYLAGKELQNELERFEPSIIVFEPHHYHFPEPHKKTGILIRNNTNESLEIVIELTNLRLFEHDDVCEPHETPNLFDKDGCYFTVPKIDRKSHQIIFLAQAEDDRVTFLTQKPSSVFYEFFFKRQPGQPERDFFRLGFILEFTVKGKLKKDSFDIKYQAWMMLRCYKPHLMLGSSHVEVEDIHYAREENENDG